MRRACLYSILAAAIGSGCRCSNTMTLPGGDAGLGTNLDSGRADSGSKPPKGDGGWVYTGGGPDAGINPGGWLLDGGPATSSGLIMDPDGGLVLDSHDVQLHFAWIANNTEGWVSKYDTDTGNEVARYYSVVPIDGLGNHLSLPLFTQNSPSRTAVDLFGNVWVANRAPGSGIQGSVTKIANDISECVDRNHDGVIETSHDTNGNGVIDPGEFIVPSNLSDPATYDECVLFTTPVGDTGADVKARALAISQGIEGTAGDIWVGLFDLNQVIRLNPDNGKIVPVTPNDPNGPMFLSLPLPNGPYGAAVDGLQRLWIVNSPSNPVHLAMVDTTKGVVVGGDITPPAGFGPSGNYGIAIDGKNRVWTAAWPAGNALADRFDNGTDMDTTANGVWTSFSFANAVSQTGTQLGTGRGIAADDLGYIWMSSDSKGAQLIGFDSDTGAIKQLGGADFVDATDSASSTSIGVGIDANENIWVNNYSGNVMRIDRNTGAVMKTASQPGSLYTYSDFTGYQLRHFTAPRGTYTQTFPGCGGPTTWTVLSWDGVQNPPTTQIQVYVKVANTLQDLSTTALRYGPFTSSPVNLQQAGIPPTFQYIELEFDLISADHSSTPELKDFHLTWNCDGQIG